MGYDDFVLVDFHTHTPASVCYEVKGGNRDQAYEEWLELCLASGTKVVAITDHTTFKGYSRIVELVNGYRERLKYWTDFRALSAFTEEQENAYQDLRKKVTLVDDIWFVPGVELEVAEGVHLLVLFPTETSSEDLQGFLDDLDVTEDQEGTSTLLRAPALDVLDAARDRNVIVVAAHIDSSNGAYNVLKENPGARLRIFTHEALYALQYNSSVTADKVKSLLLEPAYQRSSKLSFLKCSDFHNKDGESLGDPPTFLRIRPESRERRDFDAIKQALRNPDEFVSPAARPEVQQILDKLIGDPEVLRVSDVESDQGRVALARSIAALINSAPQDPGKILIGVNEHGNKVGMKGNLEGFWPHLADALKRISYTSRFYQPELTFRSYDYGDRIMVSLSVRKRPGALCAVDDKIMALRERKITVATPSEIRRMVESDLDEKYQLLSAIREKQIQDAIAVLQQSSASLQTLRMTRKLEATSRRGCHIVDITVAREPASLRGTDYRLQPTNGVSSEQANAVVALHNPPRQDAAYMRFLAPMTTLGKEVIAELPVFPASTILISAHGACYWMPKELPVFPANEIAVARVNQMPGVTAKSVLGFLKSSMFIWYLISFYGTCETMELSRIETIPVPLLSAEVLSEVEAIVDEVIALEEAFLGMTAEKQFDAVDSHNDKIVGLIQQLDARFYAAIGLTSDEMEHVKSSLASAGFWVPEDTSVQTTLLGPNPDPRLLGDGKAQEPSPTED